MHGIDGPISCDPILRLVMWADIYYSQSYHYIMSLQSLYVLKDSEESTRTKLTPLFECL
jgi:hypothetical protein